MATHFKTNTLLLKIQNLERRGSIKLDITNDPKHRFNGTMQTLGEAVSQKDPGGCTGMEPTKQLLSRSSTEAVRLSRVG